MTQRPERRAARGRPPFRDDLDLAEAATVEVTANLVIGDHLVAAALQPVARAAWALVQDREAATALRDESLRAQERLRLACFVRDERRFLRRVLDYLDGRGG